MFERRPSPSVLAIGGLIALVGTALILTGTVGWAAVVGGFWPIRVGIDPAALAGGLPLVPLALTPLSAVFIHDGWLHLGFNLLMLLVVGTPAQRAVGLRGLLVLLLIGAYAAAGAQWLVDPASPMPMVCASGAISAVIGAYALLFGEGDRAGAGACRPCRVAGRLVDAAQPCDRLGECGRRDADRRGDACRRVRGGDGAAQAVVAVALERWDCCLTGKGGPPFVLSSC